MTCAYAVVEAAVEARSCIGAGVGVGVGVGIGITAFRIYLRCWIPIGVSA